MLKTFLKHGRVTTCFEPIDRSLYKNICYLNSTRKRVTTECCNNFVVDKKRMNITFKYNNGKESYDVCIGMPVIATTNIKDKEIFNTMEFEIQDILTKGKMI